MWHPYHSSRLRWRPDKWYTESFLRKQCSFRGTILPYLSCTTRPSDQVVGSEPSTHLSGTFVSPAQILDDRHTSFSIPSDQLTGKLASIQLSGTKLCVTCTETGPAKQPLWMTTKLQLSFTTTLDNLPLSYYDIALIRIIQIVCTTHTQHTQNILS